MEQIDKKIREIEELCLTLEEVSKAAEKLKSFEIELKDVYEEDLELDRTRDISDLITENFSYYYQSCSYSMQMSRLNSNIAAVRKEMTEKIEKIRRLHGQYGLKEPAETILVAKQSVKKSINCYECKGWDNTAGDCYRHYCIHNSCKYGDVPGARDLFPDG